MTYFGPSFYQLFHLKTDVIFEQYITELNHIFTIATNHIIYSRPKYSIQKRVVPPEFCYYTGLVNCKI